MLPILTLKKITLLIVLLMLFTQLKAQLCTGNLGDPVFTIDFGSGLNPIGPALAPGVTTYTYIPGTPNNGQYTIANAITGLNPGWLQAVRNHTQNDNNGYMMVVNANTTIDAFYETTINNLCPNTTYEFSAWVINLLINVGNRPNIKFTIENNGIPITNIATGNIIEGNATNWQKYGILFTTPATVGTITFKMSNENIGGGAGNDFAIDDITFSPCGPLITNIINNAATTTQNVCEGDMQNYILSALANGFTDPIYQWQELTFNPITQQNFYNDMSGKTNLQNVINFNGFTPGGYFYRLTIAERNSPNCRIISAPFNLNVVPKPTGRAINSGGIVCVGGNIQLNVDVDDGPGTTYSWVGSNPSFNSSLKNPILNNVSPNDAGFYIVTVTKNGCIKTSQTLVNVTAPPIANINIATATICQATQVNLVASGGTTYSWQPTTGLNNPNIANPIASPNITTTYTVTVGSGTCTAQATTTITVLNNALANAGDDKKTNIGKSVTLNGSATGDDLTYFWTPTTYLDDANKLNPIATPPPGIWTYTLHAKAGSCITSIDEVLVTVYPEIKIANAFTPNGDGINDTWNIPSIGGYNNPHLIIFNRQGQIVYENLGVFNGWDGKFKGNDLPTSTYYYKLYISEENKTYTGWVLLSR